MAAKSTILALSSALIMAGATSAFAADYKVAFFAASSQNGFNQAIYEGIEKRAAALGNVETSIFDGEFNAAHQYSQIEDILASGRFDAFIVTPNDTVGIAGAIETVGEAGVPVATALFPIGPDLKRLEPQVPGVTATVGSPPADGARLQAEDVVSHCADKDPCNVVIFIGQRIYPFDALRYDTFLEVLGAHDNIKVLATGEGNYDPDQSLTAMQDILQAHSDIDVVLSNADQHLIGVEIALETAGHNVQDMYLSGGGAASIAIDAIREGRWDVTMAYFPATMGELALQTVVDVLDGKDPASVVNMDEVGPLPPVINAEVLAANPDFAGEWAQ